MLNGTLTMAATVTVSSTLFPIPTMANITVSMRSTRKIYSIPLPKLVRFGAVVMVFFPVVVPGLLGANPTSLMPSTFMQVMNRLTLLLTVCRRGLGTVRTTTPWTPAMATRTPTRLYRNITYTARR